MHLPSRIKKWLHPGNNLEEKPFYQRYVTPLHPRLTERVIAISQKYRYVFVRIPKAANSTVIATLYHAETGSRLISMEATQAIKDDYFTRAGALDKAAVDQLDHYFKFAFVRNPYTRLLSTYLDKIERRERPQRRLVTRALDKREQEDITLDEFLWYLENGGLRKNAHWAPQSELLTFPVEVMDFIGKMERFSEDIGQVLQTLFGKREEIMSIDNHKTHAEELVQSLPANIARRICRLYEKDLHCFQYKKRE